MNSDSTLLSSLPLFSSLSLLITSSHSPLTPSFPSPLPPPPPSLSTLSINPFAVSLDQAVPILIFVSILGGCLLLGSLILLRIDARERKTLIAQRLALARHSKQKRLGAELGGTGLGTELTGNGRETESRMKSGEYVIGLMQGGAGMDLGSHSPIPSRPASPSSSSHPNNHPHRHNHHKDHHQQHHHHHHSHDHYQLRHHDIHNISNHHHTHPHPNLNTPINSPIKQKPTHPSRQHPLGNFYTMGKLAIDEFRDRMLDKDAILGETVVTQTGKGGNNDGSKNDGVDGSVGGGGGGGGGSIGVRGDGDYLEERMFVGANQGSNNTGDPPWSEKDIHYPS